MNGVTTMIDTKELSRVIESMPDKPGATNKNIVMSEMEKEELKTRIKAMGEEEIMTIVEMIPIKMCVRRVENELERLQKLETGMRDIMKM